MSRRPQNNFVFLTVVMTQIGLSLSGAKAIATDAGDFTRYKKEILKNLEAECNKIVQAHRNDPAMGRFVKRTHLIDGVTSLLIERFSATRDSSMESLLNDIVDIPSDSSSKAPHTNVLNASDILAEYQSGFAEALPGPSVTASEMRVLLQYYHATVHAAAQFIAARGKLVIAINKTNSDDILELCLVMPFLHIPDRDWSRKDIVTLPEWLRTPPYLKHVERFSLRVRRPYTAYEFAQYRPVDAHTPAVTHAHYLLQAASEMLKTREYHAAIHCLRTGIDLARNSNQPEKVADLKFQLAEILNNVGHPQLAAEEMKGILDDHPECKKYGKAAMLRIKYLYEAGRFDDILKETPRYQDDERCEAFLPQIIYVSWVSHRREEHPEQADKLQQTFLSKFPEHLLAADMYFASAMAALAKSDYEEAIRLLEIIQYRYPKTRIMHKVKEIQERMKKNLKTGPLATNSRPK